MEVSNFRHPFPEYQNARILIRFSGKRNMPYLPEMPLEQASNDYQHPAGYKNQHNPESRHINKTASDHMSIKPQQV